MLNKLSRVFATVRVIVIAAMAAIAVAATSAAQDKLSKSDKKWMEEEVGPIITAQEIAMFQDIDKGDRKLFKELFWMRRDYNPGTRDNEYREDYEQRIQVANDNFKSRGRKGAESEMGAIFLLLGSPDEQRQGGSASESGLPDIPPPSENTSANQGTEPVRIPGAGGSGGNSSDTMLWVYRPNPSLGIPDGLAVEFRRREQFGYRLENRDAIEPHLERVKEKMIANGSIRYSLDKNGRLRKLDDKFDPNSPAKTLLSALRSTGETSTAIAFTTTPSFFQAAEGEIYVPIDFAISEGPTSDDLTFFYSVEDTDGFERNQAEEPVQLSKDAAGRWRYEYPIQLPPGLYTLYVGFLDSAAHVHGTQVVDLEVPTFAGDALTLSSVLMYSNGDPTDEVNGVPGKAFLLAGYHFEPKGERVYRHSEYLSGVLNAYNYGLAGKKPNLTIQVSFFKDGERRGQTADSPFAAQVPQMALTTFDIPLNIPNFKEPGDYTIEITVTDHIKNEKLTKTIDFAIEGE